MTRGNKAWLFKEVDSPLLGWEVYAQKDQFYKETGIALVANATKSTQQGEKSGDEVPFSSTSLQSALESFLINVNEIGSAVEDFGASFDPNDKAALEKYLAGIKLQPRAGYQEGYEAAVMALKANEAILKGEKVAFKKEWFELA